MKKILLISFILLLLCIVPVSASSEGGLHDGVYLIYDSADLVAFAKYVNGDITHVATDAKLMKDINLTGVSWTPIGTSTNKYAGMFDGNEHRIKNHGVHLTYTTASLTSNVYGGVFGFANKCTVKNLEVDIAISVSCPLSSGNIYRMGGLVGDVTSGITITNCYVHGSISDVSNTGSSSSGYISGVVGHMLGTGLNTDVSYITNCISDVSISSGVRQVPASSFVGSHDRAIVNCRDCYAGGHMSTPTQERGYGGFAFQFDYSKLFLENCANIADSVSGGVVRYGLSLVSGYQSGITISISNCYSNAAQTYSTGISGSNVPTWSKTSISLGSGYIGVNGQSTADIHTLSFWQDTLGWDFDNIWYWDSANNSPKLRAFKVVTITSLTLTSPVESPLGSAITATVVAEGDDLKYQWYMLQNYTYLPDPIKGLKNGCGIDDTTVNAGSKENPYAITDFADLQMISSSNWGENKYYQQTADIVLTSSLTISGFIGNYNGNGYIINGDSNFMFNCAMSPVTTFQNMHFKNIKGEANVFDLFQKSGKITFENIYFENCSIGTSSAWTRSALIATEQGSGEILISNVLVKNCVVGGWINSDRYAGIVMYNGIGVADALVTNCVVLSSKASFSKNVQRIGWNGHNSAVLSNNYASSDCTPSSSGVDPNSNAGATITSDQYNSKSWWENTAGYDMISTNAIWEWDAVTNLPKLKHKPLAILGWQPISGQTSSQLSYTQAPLGDNYFKVIIDDKVDSEAKGFQPLYVHVVLFKPIINSLTLLTTNEIPLGESLRAETNCTSYDGSPISYQWLYSIDNVTYTVISGQTTYQLTYAPPTATLYYIKLIATNKWGSTDSVKEGFNITTNVFNGIPSNTITDESHLAIWAWHYEYYNDKTLTLGNNITITNTSIYPEKFAGTFNGNNHTIINSINPLILELSGTVQNLKFKDCLINHLYHEYAGLVSATTQTATIENIDAYNCNINAINSGGITGAVLGQNTLIRNCNVNQCTVIGITKSAGITPVTQADTAITNVHITKSDITSPNGYAWGVSP